MSDEDQRRVRRVIEGAPATAPKPPVDWRQAERFQRSLGPTRRIEPDPRREPEPDTAPASTPSGTTTSESTRGTDRRPHSMPVQATVPVVEAAEEADGRSSAPADAPPPLAWLSQGDAALPAAPGWDATLVNTIATLCRHTDPSLQGFSVTVPLNAEVLPHTELRLTLSAHYLQVRFRTESTRSHELVLTHLPNLRTLLVEALGEARHLDIEVT
jgi:type III secretion control protein HpaP